MNAFQKATSPDKVGKEIGWVLTTQIKPMFDPRFLFDPLQMVRVPIIYNGYVGGNPEWELADDVRYLIPDPADYFSPIALQIPKGYKFDLASIPRALWSMIAPFELSTIAPLIHDFIYEYKGTVPPEQMTPWKYITRSQADMIFYHLMTDEGIGFYTRNAAWAAVRAFGSSYWNS